MNVQIETTKYFSVERFQSFKILENSTIMQGFSNPYIALIGRNPFRACFELWYSPWYMASVKLTPMSVRVKDKTLDPEVFSQNDSKFLI